MAHFLDQMQTFPKKLFKHTYPFFAVLYVDHGLLTKLGGKY